MTFRRPQQCCPLRLCRIVTSHPQPEIQLLKGTGTKRKLEGGRCYEICQRSTERNSESFHVESMGSVVVENGSTVIII